MLKKKKIEDINNAAKKKLDIENDLWKVFWPWFTPVCCVLAAADVVSVRMPTLPTLIREAATLLHHNGIAMQILHNNEPIALEDTLHKQGLCGD